MTSGEKIMELVPKIVNMTVGGTDCGDIFQLAKMINDADRAGSVPVFTLIPTNVYMEIFDDGDFQENVEAFADIQKRHTEAMFKEYAAWKVLQEMSKKQKP